MFFYIVFNLIKEQILHYFVLKSCRNTSAQVRALSLRVCNFLIIKFHLKKLHNYTVVLWNSVVKSTQKSD